ncbi:MAG: 5'-methylthioadenosine/adenosylhomocysteine nucleosidase [candidate division Zixibacteria bacterium]|nr:5'-methylthioadenosine/adenosylhomocysteine nucleosidase [candidate division Zixibacteria bacterium]
MIGLMGAMEEEISLFKEYATITKTKSFAGMKFYQGQIDDNDVVLVKCGIGKVHAAVSTQILIDKFDVDEIILAGLAGAVVPYLQQGDIVMANFLVQHDVDLTAFGRRRGEVPSVGRMLESDPGMLKRMNDAYDEVFGGRSNRPQMVVGTIVSGDSFISDKGTISGLQREFGAVAAEMEGAAVAQVCQMNSRPFVVIRTISDNASDDAKDQFVSNLDMAPINTFAMIRRYIAAEVAVPV